MGSISDEAGKHVVRPLGLCDTQDTKAIHEMLGFISQGIRCNRNKVFSFTSAVLCYLQHRSMCGSLYVFLKPIPKTLNLVLIILNLIIS